MSAHSSQESAESKEALKKKDSKQPGSLKKNHSAKQSSENTGQTPQSIQTLLPQTSPNYQKSTYSPEDSPAKTSATPDKKKESKAKKVGYGKNTCEPLAKYDPNTQSLKMFQHSFTGDLIPFSATFPRSGTMQNGIVSPLPVLVRLTEGTESSLLHTPTKTANQLSPSMAKRDKGSWGHNPNIIFSSWPTVQARDWKGKSGGVQKGRDLPAKVEQYPTPTTTTTGSNARKAYLKRTGKKLGQLTPEFCEWLMGFPTGYTELNPSETQSYHKLRNSLQNKLKKKKNKRK